MTTLLKEQRDTTPHITTPATATDLINAIEARGEPVAEFEGIGRFSDEEAVSEVSGSLIDSYLERNGVPEGRGEVNEMLWELIGDVISLAFTDQSEAA